MLLTSLAFAQSLGAVPPGARAVTLMLCDAADGCGPAYEAMTAHCAALGIPLLDFDAVGAAGPSGGDARANLDKALAAAAARPTLKQLEAARQALRSTPLSLGADEVFSLWLRLGDARLAAGDRAGADEAFAAAASSSAGRVWDLPALSAAATEAYLARVSALPAPSRLDIDADAPGTAWVDGHLVGPVPVQVELLPGWHRVSVERVGRRTAWVGEVQLPEVGALGLRAEIAADDAPAALEAAVIGAVAGRSPPPDVAERLADWGRGQGLRTIRFVRVLPAGSGQGPPEEQIEGGGRRWDVHATWLDVGARRFDARGAGPASLRAAADPDRFSLGLNLGYARLQASQPTGPDPHDHLAVELVAVATLVPHLAIDARVGLWASAQPWYLYEDWLSNEVVPVKLGLRWSPGDSGVYLGAQGLAVVPTALGGEAFFGWQWKPTPRWRIGLEGQGGWTDRGPVFGGGLGAAFSG